MPNMHGESIGVGKLVPHKYGLQNLLYMWASYKKFKLAELEMSILNQNISKWPN
jgi:hypothetical protein